MSGQQQGSPYGLPGENVPPDHRAGYVAILGLPNAGKSTLMNAILGQKLSIITPKAQTTRHRILGIYSDETLQMIFLDTPGIIKPSYKLQETMMAAVRRAHEDADVVVHLVDPTSGRPDLEESLKLVHSLDKPKILAINKIDAAGQGHVEQMKEDLTRRNHYEKVLSISALKLLGLSELMEAIRSFMPHSPPFFPKDQLSDAPQRFFISEIIREKLFLQYKEEIPYSCTVDISSYEESEEIDYISAEIIVDRDSQKGILIGKGGKALKNLGTAARKEIEAFLGKQVHLDLFVKVRQKWREKDVFLKSYGYQS